MNPQIFKRVLLLFLSASSIATASATGKLEPRIPDPCLDILDIAPTLDGPTDVAGIGSAGLGIELESSYVQLFYSPKDHPSSCSDWDFESAKGKAVEGHSGTNWKLTVDVYTPVDDAPYSRLNPEYVLDGTRIKIGTNAAGPAARAVASNWFNWKPSEGETVNVEGNACNPFRMTANENSEIKLEEENIDEYDWFPQVTAPFPLENINILYGISESGLRGKTRLLPYVGSGMTEITAEYFQSSPGGIGEKAVEEHPALLGFFSIVLNYAKKASQRGANDSPKALSLIMPRTDFTTIFNQVRPQYDSLIGWEYSLFEIVEILACYKTEAGTSGLMIDEQFCSGSMLNPQPLPVMDAKLTFAIPTGGNLTVKDWMKGIEDGQLPDELTTIDEKYFYGSIGGLGHALEYVPETKHAAPLFEFRGLNPVYMSDFEDWVTDVEEELIDHYDDFRNKNPALVQRRALDARAAFFAQPARYRFFYENGDEASCVSWETVCEGFKGGLNQKDVSPLVVTITRKPLENVVAMFPVRNQTQSNTVSKIVMTICPTPTAFAQTPIC